MEAAADPIAQVFNHLNDHPIREGSHLTGHIIFSWIASALTVGALVWLASRMRRRTDGVPRGVMENLLESFILYIRDEVIVPNMGPHAHHYAHFLLSMFFVILFCNLLGMIPGGQTCTGNLGVTGALALLTFGYGTFQGIRAQGIAHYLKNLAPGGVPTPILFILYPIEIAGLFIKHGVLAVRLFANMMAGHLVIGIILALPVLLGIQLITVPAFALAVGISFLELFVAFLQAYVFVMLASMFIGAQVHPEH
jgi:F-type H+-transporting ATPase subunit a